LKKGDKVLTSTHEYSSNFLTILHLVKKEKIIVEVIPNDESGQICLHSLQQKIDNKTKLIAVTHIPSNNGLINPVEEIGKIAQSSDVFYLLDATQSIGQLPLDVKKINCDALCATGRKYLRGPRGTGFLYIKKIG
jgi:selenocysteine lyase/cysteine desulfurase